MEKWQARGLKPLRKQAGKAAMDVATDIGVPRSTLTAWENGVTEMRAGQIVACADYFGVTCDEVLGHDGRAGAKGDGGAVGRITDCLWEMSPEQLGLVEDLVRVVLAHGGR